MNDIDIKPIETIPTATAQQPRRTRPSKAMSPVASNKVRVELNLEKWPGIWQPSKSKNEKALRAFQREVQNPDGSTVTSRVEVGYTHLGTLTTEERKMYGALIDLWEESGKPADRPVFFSDRLLARTLKKSWGTNVRDAIVKSLRKLRTVPVEWINSYYQKTDEGKTVLRERTPFTILSDLKIVEKEVDGVVNRAVGYFKADDRILRNLLANYTKPLLLDVILNMKSDIGVLLYGHVDLMLARKDIYERRTKDLFVDLGLTNPEYNRQYERYRALKNAVKELQGVRLSTGVLKVASIEKTKDGLDYKTVFWKVAAPALDEPAAEDSKPAVVIRHYSRLIDPLNGQAEELVRHFHKLVHGVDQHEAQSKETGQALSLITQHGFEQAKSVIDFAAARAKETNYAIQHFGAVIPYTSRALAALSQKQVVRPTKPPVEPNQTFSRGLSRLASLTSEQYQARFERTRVELFQQVPFLAKTWRPGSRLHEETIRRHLIQQLDQELMDLIPLPPIDRPDPDPEAERPPQNLPL